METSPFDRRLQEMSTRTKTHFASVVGWTAIILFTLGWILHWPSFVTLALWPVLMAAYVWLALYEERQARAEFGDDWDAYAARTKRFIPGIV
jgi:protein-S-isoprenylcysteine O-methyltransferase Ste14